ncbi:copper resistance protein CopC [Cellulomonas sp. ICMP 17802]|uniref:copper resistance CopC/CopD family protein n=1 Tax=Cellulomonas sp. ICMP 17802 TaxID=3239199 RepID=UPI00351AF57B
MNASIGSVGGRRPASAARRRARVLAVRACVLVAGVLLALVLSAPAAQAHALLVRSDPASGSALTASPSAVTLWFDEEISARLSSARLVDGGGREVAGTRVAVPTEDGKVLTLALPVLGSGTYGVLWQVLAQDDGHTSSGTVVFTVGAASAAPSPAVGASTGPTPQAVALRWARLVALAGLVGALAVLGIVVGRSRRPSLPAPLLVTARTARARLLVLGSLAAALGALVGLADLAAQVGLLRPPAGSWAATAGGLLGGTRWGRLWLGREVALLAALVLLAALRSPRGSTRARRAVACAAAAAALAVVVIEALGSHAAALDPDPTTAVVADAVHILCACLWLGAVAALAVLLWPHASGASGVALARECRTAFTRVVLASVGLVLVTGLYGAGRQIASVDDLTGTAYGRALLVKVALVAVVLVLGLLNSTTLHGARLLGRGRPFSRRLVVVEAGVGAALLVAVGLLVETAPRGDAAVPPSASVEVASGSVGDLLVTLAATPSRPGLNGFTVTVTSTRRPAPAAIDAVRLELAIGGETSEVVLRQVAAERYFGTADVTAAGLVRVDALVDRAGTRVVVPVAWRVDPPADPVEARPLAPYADVLAALLVVASVVAVLVHLRSGRRRAPAAQPVEVTHDLAVEGRR